jgi:hypothetical protein
VVPEARAIGHDVAATSSNTGRQSDFDEVMGARMMEGATCPGNRSCLRTVGPPQGTEQRPALASG